MKNFEFTKFAQITLLVTLISILVGTGGAIAQKASDKEATKPATKKIKEFKAKLFGGKALLGVVTQIVEKEINLTTKDGLAVTVTTTEVTKFLKGGKRVNLADLKVGDLIVAVGAPDPEGLFLAKTVVARPKPIKVPKKQALWGVVQEVAENSFTLSHPIKDTLEEILVTDKTVFREGKKKSSFAQLTPERKVAVLAIIEDSGEKTARLVALLPPPPEPVAETEEETVNQSE